MSKKAISAKQRQALYAALQQRFETYAQRHPGLTWANVQARLERRPEKLWVLNEMEQTGGEPDVVTFDSKTGVCTFFDCSPESPAGRRSVCYDPHGLASRKENKPKHSALGMAAEMGIEILTEADYRTLQQLGAFDAKTSSWIETPAIIRKLGGALFGDFRYGQVFFYHNGAESYYAARAFRGKLEV